MIRKGWIVLVATFMITSTAMATSFSADTVMEMNGPTMGKMYYQDSKTFRSEGMGVISIVKGPLVYSIVTDTKKYVVMKLDDLRQENPMGAWVDATELIKSNKMEKIGKETLQGYKCTIYEGDMQFAPQQPSMHMKIWYSEKLKNMLKQEATFPAPMGQIVTYLKNIKTGKQDSSLFEVPPGYTKVNDMLEAMGMGAMGNFEMPSMGSDGGQMPSKEDMKKMMEQMQDMMKKTNQ